jgi:hypothetical protein
MNDTKNHTGEMSDTSNASDEQSAAQGRQGRVVSRALARERRQRLNDAARTGALRRVGAVDLLQSARLPQLARTSLWLLLASGAGFALLDLAARRAQGAGPLLGGGPLALRLLVLVVVNLVAYVAMIVAHELMHAGVIVLLGGRPTFGLKLPLAVYCTAPGQLFTRGGYSAIALAPLVVLTLVGIVVTWLWPDLGALLWLAFVGNASGAAGDLAAIGELRRMPDAVLIADTATGFIGYGEPR